MSILSGSESRTVYHGRSTGCRSSVTQKMEGRPLDQYENTGPEIIITDLKMPVMGGIELIKEIRATDKRARVYYPNLLG